MLSVRNLVVSFRTPGPPRTRLTAVRGVSLDIEAGNIFALVGETGSGKTTLARAILQLLPAASGKVMLHGEDLARMNKQQLRQARRNIQAVFQDPAGALSPRRSILQTLLEPLDHYNIGSKDDRAERAVSVLETVGLDAKLRHRYPHELSIGQNQRVALARALVSEPELIIADEPVSSLDVSIQARIIDLILDLRERLGITFLIVSHDLGVVRRLADTVAVMYCGNLVETAPAKLIFSSPAHPYTRSLLQAVPVADPHQAAPVVLQGEPPSPLAPPGGCAFHGRCPDSMELCSSVSPLEQKVSQNSTQRVRCHLWKT
jgi:oligopeptide/dipeptide ABC transporter ATP-binding protein